MRKLTFYACEAEIDGVLPCMAGGDSCSCYISKKDRRKLKLGIDRWDSHAAWPVGINT